MLAGTNSHGFDMDTLDALVSIAVDLTVTLSAKDRYQRQGNQILGGSAVMEHLRREIDLVASSDFTVLVLGETGVGKELVVRAIHKASDRRQSPPALPELRGLAGDVGRKSALRPRQGGFHRRRPGSCRKIRAG